MCVPPLNILPISSPLCFNNFSVPPMVNWTTCSVPFRKASNGLALASGMPLVEAFRSKPAVTTDAYGRIWKSHHATAQGR